MKWYDKNNDKTKTGVRIMERKSKTGKNTRKKQKDQASGGSEDTGASLLKKNELSIIFIGAGILTVIIFFIFFNPSGSGTNREKNTPVHEIPSNSNPDITGLQKRIDKLEALVKANSSSGQDNSGKEFTGTISEENLDDRSVDSYRQRVERVETALSVKMEAVNKRIDTLEKRIAGLSDKISSIGNASGSSSGTSSEKKASKGEQKKSIFHTVQKGDTLYSIGRKYNISVEKLRRINNLDKDSAIYPGDNLVIK